MRLSNLQKYVLLEAYLGKEKKINRTKFEKYYEQVKNKPKDIVKVLTKSLERMVDKELLISYGSKTTHKLFIKEVKLTARGRRQAKQLLGEQQKLPFKKIRSTKLHNLIIL